VIRTYGVPNGKYRWISKGTTKVTNQKESKKSFGYLEISSKLFYRYALKPKSLCGIWKMVVQGI